MTLLMSSCTLTARAMAEAERGSSLCWLVEDPSLWSMAEGGRDKNYLPAKPHPLIANYPSH